jgi:hypothetical protein
MMNRFRKSGEFVRRGAEIYPRAARGVHLLAAGRPPSPAFARDFMTLGFSAVQLEISEW